MNSAEQLHGSRFNVPLFCTMRNYNMTLNWHFVRVNFLFHRQNEVRDNKHVVVCLFAPFLLFSLSRSSTWTEHIKAFEEVSRKETHAALWGKLMHRELLLNTRVTSVPLHACICISSAPMWASGQLLSATLKWRRCCGILVLWRQQRCQKSRSGYVFLVSDYWPINWHSI